ncbi:MAG: hypothetical protein N3F11_08565 [Casimicrobiaceae bacterium]|nr:hypothetical protein [Casimicrobiaceae bacterium]
MLRPRSARGFALIAVALVLGAFTLFAGYLYLMWQWSYSTGEQVGVVQKLSKKGWICKTWEGELNMVVLPGSLPEKFAFTVWSDEVAAEINRLAGRRVRLHYEEKVGLPTSCFGDTRHYITRVTALE